MGKNQNPPSTNQPLEAAPEPKTYEFQSGGVTWRHPHGMTHEGEPERM